MRRESKVLPVSLSQKTARRPDGGFLMRLSASIHRGLQQSCAQPHPTPTFFFESQPKQRKRRTIDTWWQLTEAGNYYSLV
jgi:hypothetical protein